MKGAKKDNRAPMDGPSATEPVHEATFERVLSGLRVWVSCVRRIPTALYVVLLVSVVSSTGLAYLWFWSHDSLVIRLVSIPWLLLATMSQLGLWFVASTLQDLFGVPERLWDFKENVIGQHGEVDRNIGRLEGATTPSKNIFRTLRAGMIVRTEVGQLVTARVVFQRFAGPTALVMAPLSLLGNFLIIAVGLIQLLRSRCRLHAGLPRPLSGSKKHEK